MKNKTLVLAVMTFTLGIVMLFGSSYALINNTVTKETYGFEVENFDTQFIDNTKITLNSIPTDDSDALKNSKEFTFSIKNNSKRDVNYRLDIIENSLYPMSDVIKYVYSLNNEEYSKINLLKDNNTINQNRVLKSDSTDTYKVKMWMSIDADEEYMNKMFSASISLMATQSESKYASNVIEELYNKNMDDVQKVDNDYRYTKDNPNNYVWFNCKDSYTKGIDNCQLWRIIGSFDNTWENGTSINKSLKIVSTNIYDDVAYNDLEHTGDFDNSYINTYLNGSFYDRLNNNAQDLILKAKWNIGKVNNNEFNNVIKSEQLKTYYANIGLINNSDYLYLGKDNYLKYDKEILLMNKTNDLVNVITDKIETRNSNMDLSFVPCVYLKPDVSIISGDGSINSPYELKVKFPMNYGIIK